MGADALRSSPGTSCRKVCAMARKARARNETTGTGVSAQIRITESKMASLLSLALGGGADKIAVGDAIEAAVGDLELLYEMLNAREDRFAAGTLHTIQCRLRALSELTRPISIELR
ncbi:hypothetical protein [Sorangium sp. So ce542]|uniref:hypothetical protein n=1 Tax=Sorangium sp. So ce542 TaxID=3133316 RepID=UPI003F5E623F